MNLIQKFCVSIALVIVFISCSHGNSNLTSNRSTAAVDSENSFYSPIKINPDEAVITIVGTNDIHGGFDTNVTDDEEKSLGGFQWFSGYLNAIRESSRKLYADKGTVLLLDAGDAAQGTLLSNLSEGAFAALLMNHVGYTAGVLGNHGFDFGPVGAELDQCPFGKSECDPLEAVREQFVKKAKFPLLGANINLKGSKKVPNFLKSYMLIPFFKRKIAIIGLENQGTPSTTYSENVKGLQFSDGINESVEIVESLLSTGKADVFILVTHNGDKKGEEELKKFLESAPKRSDGRSIFDAVVAGHQHVTNDSVAANTPYIQSNSGGRFFGIIQLVVRQNPSSGKLEVVQEKTQKKAAISIIPAKTIFMNETVESDSKLFALIQSQKDKVKEIAEKPIGVTLSPFSGDGKRLADSEIGNLIADMMAKSTNSEVSIIGSGDIRVGIDSPKNPLTYNDLFDVIPKNLQLQVVSDMPTELLIENIKKSVESCGRRGALQISGMKLYFNKNCSKPVGGIDPNAELIAVVLDSGQELYSNAKIQKPTVSVVTTDFVMTGGAGYSAFRKFIEKPSNLSRVQAKGAMRDLVAASIKKLSPISNSDYQVGRYVNCSDKINKSKDQCVL